MHKLMQCLGVVEIVLVEPTMLSAVFQQLAEVRLPLPHDLGDLILAHLTYV